MYQEHNVFTTPDDYNTIWRYTTWGQLCEILIKKTLFFVRSNFFEDPWENSYPEGQFSREAALKKWSPILQGSPETADHIARDFQHRLAAFESTRHETAVSCWHMGLSESDAHWRIYGQNREGVSIRSTIGDLKLAFQADEDRVVHIGEVNYVDFAMDTIPEDNSFWPIVHKRLEFANDKEVRAVVWEKERIAYNRPAKRTFGTKGVHMPIDVGALVQEIIVSPLAYDSFVETVSEAVERFGLSCSVRKSELLDRPKYRNR